MPAGAVVRGCWSVDGMCEAAAEAAAAVGRRAAFAAGRQRRFLLLPFLHATLLYLSPNAFCAQVLRDAGDNVVDSSVSAQVSDCRVSNRQSCDNVGFTDC